MAYAAVVSLLQVVDSVRHPTASGWRVYFNRPQLKSFHKKVSFLQDFLENSSSHSGKRKDPELESLETKIRYAAYKAEDVIASEISNQLRAEMEVADFPGVMRTAVLKGRYFAAQPENQDLGRAMDDISLIMEEVIKIKDACGSGQSADSAAGLSRRDFRGIGKNVVVGLDSDLNEINARLTGHSSNLEILSIEGMGGIGKTTLARQVYDDTHIVYHFDICAWVTVSQEYYLRRVMLALLDSAKIGTEEILKNHKESDGDLDQKLGEHLYKNLMGRRYLIVMDDVWDTKIWDFVRLLFPDNNNGSRVLLTTRLSEVASYAISGSPCLQMRFLNDDDSWNLLREKVFGREGCPPKLEAIGRKIARNCRGLPLAIVVVGGLLYNECRTVRDWRRVSENLNSILSKGDDQCLEILGLSYKQLPHRLKPCFLYMGAFPEDKEIRVTKLFQLWAAEGFLEASKSKSLEEVAEEYLKDLMQRNLIMVGKWRCNGKIRTCKIHDLLREVCLQNAEKENSLNLCNRDGEIGHCRSFAKVTVD